jgi:hypothetical protein
MHILVDQQLKVQAHTHGLRTERDAADGRETVTLGRTTQDHALPPGGQGPPDERRQQKAGFVEKSKVGVPLPGLAQDAREFIRLPAFDLLVVALPSALLGFMTGPAQARLEELADMLRVIRNTEVPVNESGHPSRRPQFIRITVVGLLPDAAGAPTASVGHPTADVSHRELVWPEGHQGSGPCAATAATTSA